MNELDFTSEKRARRIYLRRRSGGNLSWCASWGRIRARPQRPHCNPRGGATAAHDEPLDDLIVDGIAPDESLGVLVFKSSVKLTVSAATNSDFREIVTRAWKTLVKSDFREDIDRVGFVTGTLADASRRALEDVCEVGTRQPDA